jgi:ATP-dependent RNA circularization protein (DNA/RNA ligase family)
MTRTEFFRFPHTPHLLWLGKDLPRDDKILPPQEADAILSHDLVVEEKIDGANVGFSLDAEGALRVQNRGAFLDPDFVHPQFKPLFRWLAPRQDAMAEALFPDLVIFGEWCYAVHSVRYQALPDWLVVFDIYDRVRGEFWSTERRNDLAARLDLAVVPCLAQGRFDRQGLLSLLGGSRMTDEQAEGLYVRDERDGILQTRAKIVRPEFMQTIEEHWSKRAVEPNRLASDSRY